MYSKEQRSRQTFLRNEFYCVGKWQIPLVKKQELDITGVDLIAYSDTKSNDTQQNVAKGVHYFIDDYRMEGIYGNPERSFHKLSQYKFVLTPDYSLYVEMPQAVQLYNVFRNRWCGAYWQSKGLIVIPTISWSGAISYQYCFEGVEEGSIVAIGMIGCKHNKKQFMFGYEQMLKRIKPSTIICFGVPFPEMQGDIVQVDYLKTRRGNRDGR